MNIIIYSDKIIKAKRIQTIYKQVKKDFIEKYNSFPFFNIFVGALDTADNIEDVIKILDGKTFAILYGSLSKESDILDREGIDNIVIFDDSVRDNKSQGYLLRSFKKESNKIYEAIFDIVYKYHAGEYNESQIKISRNS